MTTSTTSWPDHGSDATVVVEGHEFKVHKAILSNQSPTFAAQLRGEWEEARTGIIRIAQFDAETVERMLFFIYKQTYYRPPSTSKAASRMSLPNSYGARNLVHARVAAIADYYCIDDLKVAALDSIVRQLNYGEWVSKGYGQLIQQIYQIAGAEPRYAKEQVCLKARDHWTELHSDAEFQTATADVGHFYKDMIGLLEKSYQDGIDIVEEKHTADLVARELIWKQKLEAEQRSYSQYFGKLRGHERHQAEQLEFVEDFRKQLAEVQKRYATAAAELRAIKAPRQRQPQTLGDLQAKLGLPKERLKYDRLEKLFLERFGEVGCCDDSPTDILAIKGEDGWYFKCRLCSKMYTIPHVSAKHMMIVAPGAIAID